MEQPTTPRADPVATPAGPVAGPSPSDPGPSAPDPGVVVPTIDAGALERSSARLRAEAMRFLRSFGLVSAAWSALLALASPEVDRPAIVWAVVGLQAAWAVAALFVRNDRAWWAGWFVVAVVLEVTAPLAGTGGWSITGGAIIVVLAGVAISGRRSWVVATVSALSAVLLGRALLTPDWSVATALANCLLLAMGGLALTVLSERIVAVVTERDALQAKVLAAETAAARATERAEAGARLHDTVLQHLTAVAHAPDLATAQRFAGRASNDLRLFLRTDRADTTSLRTLVQSEVTAAADGVEVSVSVSGDRVPDERDRLLVAATGEAVRNAVRHGAPPVRVLAEFGPRGAARVWVADHGPGFDLEQVPEDRLGVRDSIRGRMRRAGGRAMLAPGGGGRGEGTEWELVLPEQDPPADARTGSEPGPGSAGT